jgi:hypothetical protein
VAPQSGAKDPIYCAVYYITVNSNSEVQGVSKIVENTVRRQN